MNCFDYEPSLTTRILRRAATDLGKRSLNTRVIPLNDATRGVGARLVETLCQYGTSNTLRCGTSR
jgi:hypothetical protein